MRHTLIVPYRLSWSTIVRSKEFSKVKDLKIDNNGENFSITSGRSEHKIMYLPSKKYMVCVFPLKGQEDSEILVGIL